ncbi:hypothetical protein VP01_530g1 [Puccinia sorghi]|uniref:Uncharacterized protein n=1 Tax=Puccinia sorghi TaxID=27349 RepID=A0A0L6UM81_9BASI|nr:hypothetical protein VP01_530g1 [Puccinia sorghi]
MERSVSYAPYPSARPTPSTRRERASLRSKRLPHIHMSSCAEYRRMEPYIKPPPSLAEEADAPSTPPTREAPRSARRGPSQDIQLLAEACRIYPDSPVFRADEAAVLAAQYYRDLPASPSLLVARHRIPDSSRDPLPNLLDPLPTMITDPAHHASTTAETPEGPEPTSVNPYRITLSGGSHDPRHLTPAQVARIDKWRIQVYLQDNCFLPNRTLRSNWVFQLKD